MPIRIVLADDHALVRMGLRTLLQYMPEEQIVGEASNGTEALKVVEQYQPNIVIMDIAMPELNGIEVTARVTEKFPHVRVLILSMHKTEDYARRALRAGAAGYLLKDSDTAEYQLAIHALAAGDSYLSLAIAKHLVSNFARNTDNAQDSLARLTSRQREILQLIAEGRSRQEIADKLNISVKTFDGIRAELMERLNINDTASLVRYAIQKGLVDLE